MGGGLFLTALFILQCNFFVYKNTKIIYKKYGTLFFILGVDEDEVDTHIKSGAHTIEMMCCTCLTAFV